MKILSILFIALFLSSCGKMNFEPTGTWSLYNDPQHRLKMDVSDHYVSFSRNDTLLSVVEFSGDLLSSSFTMPANIWENDVPVSGSWSLHGAFLEFSYVAANRDSSLIQYIPTEIYIIDFYK